MVEERVISMKMPHTAAYLIDKDLPEPPALVEGLIVPGLTLWAGKPKLGKSWLVLAITVAVAAGGKVLGALDAVQAGTLLLALEDGERRLQRRLLTVLGDAAPPADWHYQTDWPALDDGGVDALQAWLTATPSCRLIVIDTLKRVRPKERPHASLYGQDYDALSGLADLARTRNVAIIVVHHARKASADDVLDEVSGSTGLTAVVDCIAVLRRPRNSDGATLSLTGRDIEERELALTFNPSVGTWTLDGDAEVIRLRELMNKRSAEDRWLHGVLAAGPRPRDEVFASAKAAGYARNRTYEIANRQRVRKRKDGAAGPWLWSLPDLELPELPETAMGKNPPQTLEHPELPERPDTHSGERPGTSRQEHREVGEVGEVPMLAGKNGHRLNREVGEVGNEAGKLASTPTAICYHCGRPVKANHKTHNGVPCCSDCITKLLTP